MPFLLDNMNLRTRDNYTAVIYVQIGAPLGPNNALYKLVKTITKSQFVDRVSVTCFCHAWQNKHFLIYDFCLILIFRLLFYGRQTVLFHQKSVGLQRIIYHSM